MADPVKTNPAPLATPSADPQAAANAAATKQLEDEEKARQKSNAESAAKQNAAKPTPTQHENDMAKLGLPVEEKEDDGSGPDPHALKALSAEDQAKYKNRDMGQPQPAKK